MAKTIPSRKVSDAEIEAVNEIVKRYRKQINDTPELLSLLYDIDLLPEQIGFMTNAARMVAICELMKERDQAIAKNKE